MIQTNNENEKISSINKQVQRKTICRKEKKCTLCKRTIKVGEIHYRYGNIRFLRYICKECEISHPVEDIYNVTVEGKCKCCGRCCRLATYAGQYQFGSRPSFDEFLALFGVTQEIYNKYYIYPDLKPGTVVYCKDIKCKHLKDNKCSIYDTRPRMCREFPRTMKDIQYLKDNGIDCGYKVIK